MIRKIVSGGQSGADRAALDMAIELGIAFGGWVPKGRLAEDGALPDTYSDMVEAPSSEPDIRTALNVQDSDATLVFSHGDLSGGSMFTASTAEQLRKPWTHIDFTRLTVPDAVREVTCWLAAIRPATLNVAGPRASEDPIIYSKTKRVLEAVLMEMKQPFKNPVQREELFAAALARREEALANFRHWDQVRWLVPYWYCVLATAAGGLMAYLALPENEMFLRAANGGLAIFGILCLKLVWNLSNYHNAGLQRYESFLDQLPLDDQARSALRIDLPFTLVSTKAWSSATFWFFVFIVVLTLGFGATAVFGIRWSALGS
ncbi:putative molybdenum carrier protein [Achromobacter pestifer]|uniref:Molybdenum carrier n=1 Tax=Achromobacter pestifer TaxID=1353889 RepID=A0A6S6YX68_9BURK|nr:putative molybdenum carrier protein [Achromobacter pestifer]CAB3634782.1 hypothetical protein LMG3431_01424 [Achromobacter pestifer]